MIDLIHEYFLRPRITWWRQASGWRVDPQAASETSTEWRERNHHRGGRWKNGVGKSDILGIKLPVQGKPLNLGGPKTGQVVGQLGRHKLGFILARALSRLVLARRVDSSLCITGFSDRCGR